MIKKGNEFQFLDSNKGELCIITPIAPPYGGIANWAENLLAFLRRQKVSFCILNTSPKKRVTEGRTICDRVVGGGLSIFTQGYRLRKILKGNIGVIHLASSGSLATIRDIVFMKLALRKGIKVAYHLHYGKIPEIILKGGVHWKLLKYAFGLAGCVISIDNKTFMALKRNLPDLNIKYIPNPVNTDIFIPIKESERKKEVIFLGWCIKTKGIEELIEAWEMLSDDTGWILKIAGPYKKAYLDSVLNKSTKNNIQILGELEHSKAMEALNNASIFVLPSYTEGFPMSVLEAMCLEKAIIATKVGAIDEMLGENCGIIIEKQNAVQLADGLRRLMNDAKLRSSYGHNARVRVLENYTESIVYKKYSECWKICEAQSDVCN